MLTDIIVERIYAGFTVRSIAAQLALKIPEVLTLWLDWRKSQAY